ncbi:hypothetical protein BGZ68_008765 [Mortierella alpina]|nr:hypothetical protein BGZ68_008765 [Mortierella alpina]
MASRCLYGEEKLSDDISVCFATKSFKFPSDTGDASKISDLVNSCVPSAFGMKSGTVVDTSYRNCKEIKPKDFFVSNNYHSFLPKIVAQVANVLDSPKPILASLNKLCVYETNGFFKDHVDTPQPNMFASLIVCLPTAYEGGALVVEDQPYDLSSADSIKWCAFYSDCKHRIDEVTKGFRATLTYDLLYIDVPEPTPYHDQLYKDLEKSLAKLSAKQQEPANLKKRKRQKPVQIPSLRSKAGPILKGKDVRTIAILHNLGYTTDVKAIYAARLEYDFLAPYGQRAEVRQKHGSDDEDDRNSDSSDNEWQDEAMTGGPPFKGVGDVYEERRFSSEDVGHDVLLISDNWDASFRVNEQYDEHVILELYKVGGRCLSNVAWLSAPQCKYEGPDYIAYGSEATSSTVYMDGCILAYKWEAMNTRTLFLKTTWGHVFYESIATKPFIVPLIFPGPSSIEAWEEAGLLISETMYPDYWRSWTIYEDEWRAYGKVTQDITSVPDRVVELIKMSIVFNSCAYAIEQRSTHMGFPLGMRDVINALIFKSYESVSYALASIYDYGRNLRRKHDDLVFAGTLIMLSHDVCEYVRDCYEENYNSTCMILHGLDEDGFSIACAVVFAMWNNLDCFEKKTACLFRHCISTSFAGNLVNARYCGKERLMDCTAGEWNKNVKALAVDIIMQMTGVSVPWPEDIALTTDSEATWADYHRMAVTTLYGSNADQTADMCNEWANEIINSTVLRERTVRYVKRTISTPRGSWA